MLPSFHVIKIALKLVNQVGSDLRLRDQPVIADWFSLQWDACTICNFFFFFDAPHMVLGEDNGTPFQYSCLENPMDRGAWVGWSPWGREESDMTEQLHFHFSLSRIGQENGNPLQCSCLENPRDGEAWWAAVYGVAQSRTRLKRLSSSDSTWFWGTAKFENPWIHGSLGFWGAWWKWLMEEHEAKHHHITVMMTGAKLSRGYGKETNLGKHA